MYPHIYGQLIFHYVFKYINILSKTFPANDSETTRYFYVEKTVKLSFPPQHT